MGKTHSPLREIKLLLVKESEKRAGGVEAEWEGCGRGNPRVLAAPHSRLEVENQGSILQPHGVAAHGVVDELGRGEGRLPPVQEDGGGGVGFGIQVVRRGRRGHHAVTDSCWKHNRSSKHWMHINTALTALCTDTGYSNSSEPTGQTQIRPNPALPGIQTQGSS